MTVRVTPDTIERISTSNGLFHVPDGVKAAIEACLANNDEKLITEKYRSLRDQFIGYRQSTRPAQIDYNDEPLAKFP